MGIITLLNRIRLAGTGWSEAHVKPALDQIDALIAEANAAAKAMPGSSGTRTATFGVSTTAEEIIFTARIPANTIRAGALMRLQFLFEVLTLAVGEVRFRMRIDEDPLAMGTGLDGFFPVNTVRFDGFEFVQAMWVDEGGGLASMRLTSGGFTDIDVSGIDTTVDQYITFTGQPTDSNAGNSYVGLAAMAWIAVPPQI